MGGRWRRPERWLPLLLLAFALVTTDVLLDGPLRRADLPLAAWMSAHIHGPAWWAARVLAGFGQRSLDAVPLGLATVAASWRRRRWEPVLWTLAVLALLGLGVQGLKTAVGRTGPGTHGAVLTGGLEYPSGHTINGIVLWGMVLQLVHDLGEAPARVLTDRRRHLLCCLTGLGVGIGLVGIGWHWFTDVLAGWLLGPCALWLTLRAHRRFVAAARTSSPPPRTGSSAALHRVRRTARAGPGTGPSRS